MMSSSRLRRLLLVCPLAAIAFGVAANGRQAHADPADAIELKERCATRLSIALLGKSADTTLRASIDPQANVDTMLQSPDFVERFSRYITARFNPSPGVDQDDDATYFLAKKILTENKAWSEMFLGPYRVENGAVVDDPQGLGYMRSPAWLLRYAGNEGQGLKIVTAARMLKNIMGLNLQAVTNAPNVDISATGRQAPACAVCHYDNWYALDKVAGVLSRKKGEGDDVTFDPNPNGPQSILDGQMIADDKGLVTALVANEGYRFNVCRLAFNFLTGRPENKCEGPVFDKCMDEFSAKKTMQSAIAAIAKDVSYCQ